MWNYINEVLCHSTERNRTGNFHDMNNQRVFQNYSHISQSLATIWHQTSSSTLVWVKACCLLGAKQLTGLMLLIDSCTLRDIWYSRIWIKIQYFLSRKGNSKCLHTFCAGLNVLTDCGLMMLYMATGIWVNIGSSNGLLPGGTKPLPEWIFHQ